MQMIKTALIVSCIAALPHATAAKDVVMAKAIPAITNPAQEKAEIEKAFAEWRAALITGKAENVVKLYDPEAVLLPTLSAEPITTQDGRMDYFTRLTARPNLSVSVDKKIVRLLDTDNAVISGLYTFSFTEKDAKVSIPARYSFVFEKISGRWMIVEHHSSRLPQPQ